MRDNTWLNDVMRSLPYYDLIDGKLQINGREDGWIESERLDEAIRDTLENLSEEKQSPIIASDNEGLMEAVDIFLENLKVDINIALFGNGPFPTSKPKGLTPEDVESVIAEVEKELFNLGCSAAYALVKIRDRFQSLLSQNENDNGLN